MPLSRRSLLSGLGLGLAAPWVRPARADAGSLNIYNWSDYIAETTIDDFQTETGISVIYDLYASTEEMQARMQAGATGYDVVIQSGQHLPEMAKAGIYQTLDKTRLKNWGKLDPAILNILEGFDPGHAFGVPYLWGSAGFIFNLDMVRARLPKADPADLATIFAPGNAARLADCGISLLDSPTDLGFMVLSWLGIDPAAARQADFDRMVAAFRQIRPHVATFDNSRYIDALTDGTLCVANAWSGDFPVVTTRAKDAGLDLNLTYAVPKSGAPAWFDLWCIPADAGHVDPAYTFLDYMLRPDVIAKCTDYTGYANANRAATALVDPSIAGNPAIYPDAETLRRLYAPKPLSPDQALMLTRAWSEITAK